MFKVMMIVDGEVYEYGRWADREIAVKVSIDVFLQRNVHTFVEEE